MILKQSQTQESIYFFKECHLNIGLISQAPEIPLIHTANDKIILNTNGIKSIDATGLAWLMKLIRKYRDLGKKVILTDNKMINDALNFLGLEDILNEEVELIKTAV